MISPLTDRTNYTDKEIDRMRARLAKAWRQSKSQVTDNEARWYLDLERELEKQISALPADSYTRDDK